MNLEKVTSFSLIREENRSWVSYSRIPAREFSVFSLRLLAIIPSAKRTRGCRVTPLPLPQDRYRFLYFSEFFNLFILYRQFCCTVIFRFDNSAFPLINQTTILVISGTSYARTLFHPDCSHNCPIFSNNEI